MGLDASEAMAVAAAVADALLVVGALPPESSLLCQLPAGVSSRWRSELAQRFVARERDRFLEPSGERVLLALGVRLPFEQATVVIDAAVMRGDCVYLQLFAAPETPGEYWPVAMRSVEVRASDDAGGSHDAIGATHWRTRAGEGWGDLMLWTPIARDARRMRLEVSTLFEAAWADIELPAR